MPEGDVVAPAGRMWRVSQTSRRAHNWADPGVEHVAPGVHRIPLPLPTDGLRAVNVYVLETDTGLTCIDAGWAIESSRELLRRGLKSIGYEVGDITLGIGEKATLDLFNSGELASDPTVPRLRLAGASDLGEKWRDMFEGRDPDSAQWAYPDRWLDGEHTIDVGDRTLRAVPTPGHTAGHFVFAGEQAGVLFAGDHVLPTITPSVGFELVFVDDPLGDFLGSLERVRELPDLRLLPAHGPFGMSSHARVDELLAHHDQRLELCRAAVAAGAATAYDVARQLSWTRHERHFDELDVFNAALASMETMAHLDLLTRRGALRRELIDGTAGYATTAG